MKIIVIGAGNQIPTFILRRLRNLDKIGIQQIVYGPQKNQLDEFNHLTFIKKLSSSNFLFFDFFKRLLLIVLNIRTFFKILSLLKTKNQNTAIKTAIQVLPIGLLKNIEVIHIQWIIAVSEWAWLKQLYPSVIIIGSARGSDLTIFPATKKEYAEKLKESISQCDFIHCVSNDIALNCLKYGAAPEKVFINYNGIDTMKFIRQQPIPSIIDQQKIVLLTIGSLIPRKGIIFQLLIVKNLICKGYNVELIIIGDGELKEVLKYESIKLEINNNIHFMGQQSEESILQMLSAAHIYLSTSYAEGLSNSVMEAASMSLPVIAFQCEGMSEIIEDRVTGFIVPYGDIDQVIDHIIWLIKFPKEYHSMAEKARNKTATEFNSFIHINKMKDFLEKINDR